MDLFHRLILTTGFLSALAVSDMVATSLTPVQAQDYTIRNYSVFECFQDPDSFPDFGTPTDAEPLWPGTGIENESGCCDYADLWLYCPFDELRASTAGVTHHHSDWSIVYVDGYDDSQSAYISARICLFDPLDSTSFHW